MQATAAIPRRMSRRQRRTETVSGAAGSDRAVRQRLVIEQRDERPGAVEHLEQPVEDLLRRPRPLVEQPVAQALSIQADPDIAVLALAVRRRPEVRLGLVAVRPEPDRDVDEPR